MKRTFSRQTTNVQIVCNVSYFGFQHLKVFRKLGFDSELVVVLNVGHLGSHKYAERRDYREVSDEARWDAYEERAHTKSVLIEKSDRLTSETWTKRIRECEVLTRNILSSMTSIANAPRAGVRRMKNAVKKTTSANFDRGVR